MLRNLLFALPVLGGVGYFMMPAAPVSVDQAVEARIAADPDFDERKDGVRVSKNIAAYHEENLELIATRKKARDTLRTFFKMEMSGVKGNYTIKFPLTQNGETEHIWMNFTEVKDGFIHGTLANDPMNGPGLKLGDAVSVKLSDMEDWMVATSDGLYGGYTTRLMLKDMEPAKAAALKAMFVD